MSWQEYVDNQICSEVESRLAVIASLDEGVILAKFEKDLPSPISQDELKTIADAIRSNPQSFYDRGIKLGGERYMCIKAEPDLVLGKKQKLSLCFVATKTYLVGAVSMGSVQPSRLNVVVAKLGDYLKESGY